MNFYYFLIQFVLSFTIIYFIYYFFILRKCKKDRNYVPSEVNLIIIYYHIDVKKIDIYKFVKLVSFITTLDISLTISIVGYFFNNTLISLIFGTLISLLLAIIFYRFIGSYYYKKSVNKK